MQDDNSEKRNLDFKSIVESYETHEIPKQVLLEAILERVEYFLSTDAELLFSYLYRLDVDEQKIKYVLNHQTKSDIPTALSELILERQLERIAMKKRFPVEPVDE